jgi:Ca2+:H+ antiporter
MLGKYWPLIVPIAAAAVLGLALAFPPGPMLLVGVAIVLIGAVIAAVHHAEVVAHRVGEPFGTLVLALAVTVIEVALIISVMLAGDAESATLPRDTLFAAVMIICNGVVGACLLLGAMRHREQVFRIEGASAGLASVIALATLSLVMPTLTISAPGARYTTSQLLFVAVASLALWLLFVFVQTVRHRDYFLPPRDSANEDVHAQPPTDREAWASVALLLVSLVVVVGLAKTLSPAIEAAVSSAGAPRAVIGIAIALLVLLPETWAAIRAARADRIQTSLNLAYGSALASIGLTIPVVVAASVLLELPLRLGLDAKDIALLTLTFLVSPITLATGRTNMMPGGVHLVIFAAFLFLALVP